MITVTEAQLYQMLTIFFGIEEWTPTETRAREIANKLGDALLASEMSRINTFELFCENLRGRRDFLARGGKIS